jgi:hypothetical protein
MLDHFSDQLTGIFIVSDLSFYKSTIEMSIPSFILPGSHLKRPEVLRMSPIFESNQTFKNKKSCHLKQQKQFIGSAHH